MESIQNSLHQLKLQQYYTEKRIRHEERLQQVMHDAKHVLRAIRELGVTPHSGNWVMSLNIKNDELGEYTFPIPFSVNVQSTLLPLLLHLATTEWGGHWEDIPHTDNELCEAVRVKFGIDHCIDKHCKVYCKDAQDMIVECPWLKDLPLNPPVEPTDPNNEE